MKIETRLKREEYLRNKQKAERDDALKKYLKNGGKMYDLDHQSQIHDLQNKGRDE